jgi:hypothetical protein
MLLQVIFASVMGCFYLTKGRLLSASKGLLGISYYCSGIKILSISTEERVLLPTKPIHKTLLTTFGCAVARLSALVASQSARLTSNKAVLYSIIDIVNRINNLIKTDIWLVPYFVYQYNFYGDMFSKQTTVISTYGMITLEEI